MKQRYKMYKACRQCVRFGNDRCPFAGPNDCPDVVAEGVVKAVSCDDEVAKRIPMELFIQVAKAHGYTGELRKTFVKII